jgi:hypothetical protein
MVVAGHNVAQFVAFTPAMEQTYSAVRGWGIGHAFDGIDDAARNLINSSGEGLLNVRSYRPDDPQGCPFLRELNAADAANAARSLCHNGYSVIINESIALDDGGVSGVIQGGVVEFAPGVTPRFVEQSTEDIPAWPRGTGLAMLQHVYGELSALCTGFDDETRVEFSVHPARRGYLHDTAIIWEAQHVGAIDVQPSMFWPCRFSRHIGDKAFGLLVAACIGLPVPSATVYPRNRALTPFTIGSRTHRGVVWMRTSPAVQMPGKYTTCRGWRDPYELMQADDPDGTALASCLAQDGVRAKWSGTYVTQADGTPLVEGCRGYGDEYMLAQRAPEDLPDGVRHMVMAVFIRASVRLMRPVRGEWVYDGERVWVVQLHTGASASQGRTIVPGEATHWHRFDPAGGMAALDALIGGMADGEGILFTGHIGVGSHFADKMRKGNIPSRIAQ